MVADREALRTGFGMISQLSSETSFCRACFHSSQQSGKSQRLVFDFSMLVLACFLEIKACTGNL